MGIESRRLLEGNDNTIDDVLRAVGMSTSSFDYNKSINKIVGNAPVNPFAPNITPFFADYDRGPFEMEWFRQYDHFLGHSGSSFTVMPTQLSAAQVTSTSTQTMNSLGWNTRPHLHSHSVGFDELGNIAWSSGSLMSFTYRTTNSSNQECKITTVLADAAASIYNGNVDTETISTTVQSFAVAALDRTFASSSRCVMAYRNSADGADTYARVFNVDAAGAITFENAVEISTSYNQLFNKGLNLGQNKAVFASMRGGNDINLHYFKYNGANNYTRGTVQVASTQHAGYPTMAYINDDLVAYIYTRRPSSSGNDRYINLKLYDTSTFPPTLLGTATEYDLGSQRLGRMGDCAVARTLNNPSSSFGVFVNSDTTNNKGVAYPFEITTRQEDASSPTLRILPSGTSTLVAKVASGNAQVSDTYRAPHHVISLGVPPNDDEYFYYFAIIAPGFGWIFKQSLADGSLTNVKEGDMGTPGTTNNYRRADYHYFSAAGNGHRGVPAGGYEWFKTTLVVCGEHGEDGGDMYIAGGGIILD